ncbi:MAG: FAD synthetase family protein [Bacteroidales bacterium]
MIKFAADNSSFIMKVHTDFNNFGEIKNAVVTTGTFDGVHIGHKTIINRLTRLAAEVKGESVLISFYPHPAKILFPDKTTQQELITTPNEKIQLLRETGLNHLFLIPFTPEFAKISSRDFVTDILQEKLGAKIIIVGGNHHFGHNREGNFNYLYRISKSAGFMVEEIPMQDIEDEVVSSTRIRKALSDGNIQNANAYLDHFFLITGNTVRTNDIASDHNAGFYKVEIDNIEKLIPPTGKYAVRILENNARGIMIIEKQTDKPNLVFMCMDKDLSIETNKVYSYAFHQQIHTTNKINNLYEYIHNDINAVNQLI